MARGNPERRLAIGGSVAMLFLAGSLVSGCTKLLGIDGDYVINSRPGAVTVGDGGANTDAGSGGASGSGGVSVNSGGTSTGGASSGGSVSDSGSGGTPPGTGGAPSDAGCVTCCEPGTYTGTFTGKHGPSLTFVGVPFPVGGTVTLTTSGKGSSLQVTGTFDGTFSSCPGTTCSSAGLPPFSMVVSGTFDCANQTVTGTVDSGKTGVQVNLSLVGKFSGSLDGSSGTWTESEDPPVPQPAAPGNGTGSGSWSVTRSKP